MSEKMSQLQQSNKNNITKKSQHSHVEPPPGFANMKVCKQNLRFSPQLNRGKKNHNIFQTPNCHLLGVQKNIPFPKTNSHFAPSKSILLTIRSVCKKNSCSSQEGYSQITPGVSLHGLPLHDLRPCSPGFPNIARSP